MSYDSFNYEEAKKQDIAPIGPHKVIVKASVDERDGDREWLAMELRTVDGNHMIRARMWKTHPNPSAESVGHRELARAMDCFGVDINRLRSMKAGAFTGKMGDIVVKHREYNGKTYADVEKWLPKQAQQPTTEPAQGGVVKQSTYTPPNSAANADDEPPF